MAFICEIGPARPPEDGSGGVSYELRSVYRIREPVALRDMQLRYGVRGAPRGLMYVPEGMLRDISWGAQDRVLVRGEERLFGIWKSVSLPVPRIEDSIGRWEVPNQTETLAEMDTTNFTDVSNTRDVDMDVDLHVSLKRRRGEDDALLEPTLKKPVRTSVPITFRLSLIVIDLQRAF